MARTAEIIQQEIDDLRSAIATGASRVRFADREVEYKSTDDMNKALLMLLGELGIINGVPKIRQVRFATSKGIRPW